MAEPVADATATQTAQAEAPTAAASVSEPGEEQDSGAAIGVDTELGEKDVGGTGVIQLKGFIGAISLVFAIRITSDPHVP